MSNFQQLSTIVGKIDDNTVNLNLKNNNTYTQTPNTYVRPCPKRKWSTPTQESTSSIQIPRIGQSKIQRKDSTIEPFSSSRQMLIYLNEIEYPDQEEEEYGQYDQEGEELQRN